MTSRLTNAIARSEAGTSARSPTSNRPAIPTSRCARIEQEQSQDDTTDNCNGCKVPRRRVSNIGTAKSSFDRHAKAEFLLEGNTPIGDEVIAGIRAALRSRVAVPLGFAPKTFCLKNRPAGNFTLVVRRAPREFFNCMLGNDLVSRSPVRQSPYRSKGLRRQDSRSRRIPPNRRRKPGAYW